MISKTNHASINHAFKLHGCTYYTESMSLIWYDTLSTFTSMAKCTSAYMYLDTWLHNIPGLSLNQYHANNFNNYLFFWTKRCMSCSNINPFPHNDTF